ncbi:MAG: DUF6327 family protein [Maribacter sp.]
MKKRNYTSFSEIDNDLKILSLEQEVARESIKYNYQNVKNSIYPTNLLGGFSGIVQKLIVSLVAKKVLKKFS